VHEYEYAYEYEYEKAERVFPRTDKAVHVHVRVLVHVRVPLFVNPLIRSLIRHLSVTSGVLPAWSCTE
jgi:hypothetical protein